MTLTSLMTYSMSCTMLLRRRRPDRAWSPSCAAKSAGDVVAPSETTARNLSPRVAPTPLTLTPRSSTICTTGFRFVSPASAAATPFGVSLAIATRRRPPPLSASLQSDPEEGAD
uniref:Uncharacterized protein n=1 Tax=Leersia perrieri TaxID=77586 RepID=A0A0D9VLR3_9ORYZ